MGELDQSVLQGFQNMFSVFSTLETVVNFIESKILYLYFFPCFVCVHLSALAPENICFQFFEAGSIKYMQAVYNHKINYFWNCCTNISFRSQIYSLVVKDDIIILPLVISLMHFSIP